MHCSYDWLVGEDITNCLLERCADDWSLEGIWQAQLNSTHLLFFRVEERSFCFCFHSFWGVCFFLKIGGQRRMDIFSWIFLQTPDNYSSYFSSWTGKDGYIRDCGVFFSVCHLISIFFLFLHTLLDFFSGVEWITEDNIGIFFTLQQWWMEEWYTWVVFTDNYSTYFSLAALIIQFLGTFFR